MMVPRKGLEPLRIAPPDPKSGASANFATWAIFENLAKKPLSDTEGRSFSGG